MQRGKNRPYLLKMSNYTVYFNAKQRFWARARRNGHQLVLSQSAAQCPVQHCTRQNSVHSQTPGGGGTCPSAPCLATPLPAAFIADWRRCYTGHAQPCDLIRLGLRGVICGRRGKRDSSPNDGRQVGSSTKLGNSFLQMSQKSFSPDARFDC